jgi:hypothetical protein
LRFDSPPGISGLGERTGTQLSADVSLKRCIPRVLPPKLARMRSVRNARTGGRGIWSVTVLAGSPSLPRGQALRLIRGARTRLSVASVCSRASTGRRWWIADLTYLRTWEGGLYLAAPDAYTRRILGWAIAEHMRAEFVVEELQMAVARRRLQANLLLHIQRTAGDTSATSEVVKGFAAKLWLARPPGRASAARRCTTTQLATDGAVSRRSASLCNAFLPLTCAYGSLGRDSPTASAQIWLYSAGPGAGAGCRRRDSNPRHADYDARGDPRSRAAVRRLWTQMWTHTPERRATNRRRSVTE